MEVILHGQEWESESRRTLRRETIRPFVFVWFYLEHTVTLLTNIMLILMETDPIYRNCNLGTSVLGESVPSTIYFHYVHRFV